MNLRIITRVITYDPESRKILLVKNKDQDFWYPPGGGWHYGTENLLECARRGVKEETGLDINISRLLYIQEFHDAPDSISLETMWLAKPQSATKLDVLHVDKDVDGKVESAKWFSKNDLRGFKVFPKRLQNTFWDNIERFLREEDPFIEASYEV